MNEKLGKFEYYCLFLAPTLAQYQILGGKLDLDVIVLILVLILVLHRGTKINGSMLLIVYLGYTAFVVLVNCAFGNLYVNTSDVILRAGRYCLYLAILGMCLTDSVEYNDAMEVYRKIVFAAFIYIIIQYICYNTVGIVLPKKIGMHIKTAQGIARLSSFFSEPAEMAYNLLPFVTCSLFGPQYRTEDSRFFDAICISLAVILSTSSQGVVVVLVLWLLWLFSRGGKDVGVRIIQGCLVFAIGYLVFRWSDLLTYSLGRLSGGMDSTAWSARSGGYTLYSYQNIIEKIFGVGYGNYPSERRLGLNTYGNYINFSSLAESLFTQGILGTFIYARYLISLIKGGGLYKKILFLVIVILSIGGAPLTGKYLSVFFTIILSTSFIGDVNDNQYDLSVG